MDIKGTVLFMSNWCTSDFTVQAFSGLFTESVFTQMGMERNKRDQKMDKGLNGTLCLSQPQFSLQLPKLCYSSSFLMEETSILHLSQREPSHSAKKWNTAAAAYTSGTHQNIPVSDDAKDAFFFFPNRVFCSFHHCTSTCQRTVAEHWCLRT